LAATFVIGLSLGAWIGGGSDASAIAAADKRPRAVSGETRLLMDQSFEQFARRVGGQGRASASPGNSPPRREGNTAPKRSEQARVKSN
jgi:hypothetical protein